MKLKEGDMVVCHGNQDGVDIEGWTGTVLEDSARSIPIRFDLPDPNFHSCGELCEEGYGWWVDRDKIELIETDMFPLWYEEKEK